MTKHICNLFDISHQTVKVWSKEFGEYLSPTATPGKNRVRRFTDDDLKVFDLVAQLKNDGGLYEDIHASLASGQRGDMPEKSDDITPVPVTGQVRALQAKVSEMEQYVTKIRTERDETHGENRLLKEQLEAYKQEIAALNQQIGSLKAQSSK